MEGSWDPALLRCGDQLPPELLSIIQHGSNEQYLEVITKASLDARYTYLLFAHCENIFAHVCASLGSHGTLPSAITTLGRILPFAPYLAPYATQLLCEPYTFDGPNTPDEDLLYMLGAFRFLRHDYKAFRRHINLVQVQSLLRNPSRPVVYMAIRIMQICLDGADHWFEQMVREHLGEDNPDSDINAQWDEKVIDYRFLTLWEEERYEKVEKLMASVQAEAVRSLGQGRTIPADCFHPSTALVGGLLLPRESDAQSTITHQLVVTPAIRSNLLRIATALKSPRPLLLTGLAGSGKTLLARHVAAKLGKLETMVTLHLNEQSDAKLLVGIYTTGDTPGSFLWKPGVLTTAVEEGRWVLIEGLDRAPNEVIGTLLPLIERRELLIPSRKQTIYAAPGFRILATVRSAVNHRGEETRPLAHMLGARHWQNVVIDMLALSEQKEVAQQLFPSLSQLLPQFMAVYERLRASRQRAALVGQSKTGVLRAINPQDLLKWCGRVMKLLRQRSSITSSDVDDMFMEAVDCFVGALPDGPARTDMAAVIAEELRKDPQRRDYLLGERDVRYEVDKNRITVGRYSLPRMRSQRATPAGQGTFSTNAHTSRMLERVAAAVINREPLLLVGETGVGKTAAVQHLASHLGKKLEPFNLSHQSEAGDLLGGFKPITARSLIIPMKDEFDALFRASFSMSKNQQFLELLNKQMARSNWKAVCKLWQQALKMVDQQRSASTARLGAAPSKKRKVEFKLTLDIERWDAFAANVTDMDRRLSAGTEAFAFSFVEGNIVKAVRHGDWVLLDEINLASPDTLESIADLLDPAAPSLLLTEAGNIERIEAHPEFRIFAAMNPATDVGKKDLPPGIRSRFTELYVEGPDKDIKSLQSIVCSYLRSDAAVDPAVAVDASTLYQKIIALTEQNKLVDGAGQKPHFSLRTLTRTLSYAKYVAPQCNLRRALYEGFQMNFLTFLDAESARMVQPLLEQYLLGKRTNIRAELKKALRKPNDGKRYVQGCPGSKHWVHQGSLEPLDQPDYILTPFIKTNLENLVRATSTRQFPVLIQGPTSSGKTSMIEYLANCTGHKFVRINNHEHTDLQEYLGTYVSGADGRLHFQEGVLVQALREGHWIVLDELNLAPSDVLEALNRLLDENRELLILETQETVRPHGDFMLFATQNPAGLYGGRKTLSRAFRNRFLELHFDDIPIDELQEILHRRTQLPESRCKRIVNVYNELALLRQENRVFEQKSFATLRDLFRWAFRPNDSIEQLAANGFMLLAERVRKPEEREALKATIEKAMSANGPRVIIDENALYELESAEIQAYQRNAKSSGVVWTKAMRRLYVLVSRAIQSNEPVLLVGETGCGKTTVCQMLAEALSTQLHTVNAHQNTETGDLIGSQRPVRNRAAIEATLRKCLLNSPPLQNLDNAAVQPMDALLSTYDHAVSTLDLARRQTYCSSTTHLELQSLRTRFKAWFEWADGSLVQAMRDGTFFLLDEISLADDSVLERVNSVLESQRSILLAEKGSLDSFVTASSGFQFFATMNPGGDYGKRELSPALRNRFTEIWVPPLSDAEDIVQIVSAKLTASASAYATAMVTFAQWFKDRYNTSASSSVSIRDSLAWAQFVNIFAATDSVSAIVHGAAMVYIDTLGANPAGLMTLTGRDLDEERLSCLAELSRLLEADAGAVYSAPCDIGKGDRSLIVGPFMISSRSSDPDLPASFTFDAQTTRRNAMQVVRAMQLSKPVMLEGSPGVGKTALVTAIATAAGIPLTRINLSEQTDLLDLFGSDAPVEGAATGTFAWRDAPFLRAMKSGDWVLLDEINLASQSVLEGLNACLDHRGEVFIPELAQTFAKHPDFRLFTAQNPHHQGGGRKGLPTSFVNRFTVVYADAFQLNDLMLICQRSFPQVHVDVLEQAVRFVNALDVDVVQHRRFGAIGGPWEFNLRDISRWLTLMSSDRGLLKAGNARDFVDFLFTQRFRSAADRTFVGNLFESVFTDNPPPAELFSSISPVDLQLGYALLSRDCLYAEPTYASRSQGRSSAHLRALASTMLCVQQRWPVILTGSSGCGKTALIEGLAAAVGAPLTTIALSADTDAMDLIGGYEQSDPLRQSLQALEKLRLHFARSFKMSGLASTSLEMASLLTDMQVRPLDVICDPSRLRAVAADITDDHADELFELVTAVQSGSSAIDKARFEWTDGLLTEALEQGRWLILDNANLCSPSVLDRLNSLLEQDGSLIVNEHTEADGSPRIICTHPNFRIFLTLDPRCGELSRAMRNRAVEIYLPPSSGTVPQLQPLQQESAMTRYRQARALKRVDDPELAADIARLAQDHTSTSDQPLRSRFAAQLDAGLFGQLPLFSADLAAPSRESLNALTGFYNDATSQAQASADYACVQTLHPLNNQALAQQNHSILSRASTLALEHDFRIRVTLLFEKIVSCKSRESVMRQLERAERAALARRESGGPGLGLLAALEKTMQLTLEWVLIIGVLPLQRLSQIRHILQRLYGYWAFILHDLAKGVHDPTLLTAWLAAFRSLAENLCEDASAPTQSLLPRFLPLLDGVASPSITIMGCACAVLWEALRPPMPRSMAQLQTVLDFEHVVHRFDQACRRFELPIPSLIKTRMSFARTLKPAVDGDADVRDLSQQLETLLPAATKSDDGSSLGRRPHFAQAFEGLSQHAVLLLLAGRGIPAEQIAAIEMVALRSTSDSILTAVETHERPTVRNELCLLSRFLGPADVNCGHSQDPLSVVLQQVAGSAGTLLHNLSLLESESSLLGQIVGRYAHTFELNELQPLDACLSRALVLILTTLVSGPADKRVRAMSSQVLARLEATSNDSRIPVPAAGSTHNTSDDGVLLTGLQTAFDTVVGYLRSTETDQQPRLKRAADAWTAFGTACLTLYLPQEPFDPTLQPHVEREVHRHSIQDLERKLLALRTFRTALSGEESSLRSRVLQEDIVNMGTEPIVHKICRPSASAVSDLQAEFDGLLRVLTPMQQGAVTELADDTTFWTNLDRIRSRLSQQYRAYGDLTGPVVGFLDCMRIGRHLTLRAEACSQAGSPARSLERIVPFVGASSTDWCRDETFVELLRGQSGQTETLLALSVLAARTQIDPLSSASFNLVAAVDQQFEEFFNLWRSRLSEDQRRTAAKSSLYRYKGAVDLVDEGSTDELAQLFPTHSDNGTAAGPVAKEVQGPGSEIALLHHAIFRGHALGSNTLLRLIEQYADSIDPKESDPGAARHIPAILWSLHNMAGNLSGATSTERSYNMYVDPNVQQAKRAAGTIMRVQRRFGELHAAWPEHATPVETERMCDHVLQIGHAEPLTKFLPLLEKLQATMTQWQQIASREYSVGDELEELTGLIVSWRQLELSSWGGLLNREDDACRRDTSSWWYVAYENIVAVVRTLRGDPTEAGVHIEGLLRALESFIGSCSLAEYVPRLDMLRDFEAHLTILAQHDRYAIAVRQALANFVAYHMRFEHGVTEKLAKGRTDFEKEIKNVIQVASWKDRNVQTLKQSATSSHMKLLRLVRKYRTLLAQPVGPRLVDGMLQDLVFAGPAFTITPTSIMMSTNTEGLPATLYSLAWKDRPARFQQIQATVSIIRSKSEHLRKDRISGTVSRYGKELRANIDELQKETPPTLNDQNKSQAQDLKRRKRRLLADVIRDVQNMGFQRSMGEDSLSQQAALHSVLCNIPALTQHAKSSILAGAEHYFHRLLSILPSARESARKHSEDLTPAEAARCVTLLESMLQTSMIQRSFVCEHLEDSIQLQAVLRQFSSFASTIEPTLVQRGQSTASLNTCLRSLSIVIQTCTVLVEAQADLAGNDLSMVTDMLRTHADRLTQLENDVRSEPSLPAGIGSSNAVLLHSRSSRLIQELSTAVSSCIQSNPETKPLLDHIQRWTGMDDSADAQANGHIHKDSDRWASELLQSLDAMLGAVEKVEKASATSTTIDVEKRWLIRQGKVLHSQSSALGLQDVIRKLSSLLSSLRHVTHGPGQSLSALAGICRSVRPIIDVYAELCQETLNKATSIHFETNKLAYQLAAWFLQLAQRGFCTPPEKADAKNQQTGDVESGTGLGDGEGGEDISKDVGDDEDLSELAQEPQAGGKAEDFAEEKDAVDMADQEMEGVVGGEPESSENGEGDADESPEADEQIEEEAGSVDDQGTSTIDEKIWDDGNSTERPEKEANSMRGFNTNEDVAAARDGQQQQHDETSEEAEPQGDSTAADEDEHVESHEMKLADPHAEEQENLDLPTDINMDGKTPTENVDSNMDEISEDVDGDPDATRGSDEVGRQLEDDGIREDKEEELLDYEAPTEERHAADEVEKETSEDSDAISDLLINDDKDTVTTGLVDNHITAESGRGEDADQSEGREATAPSAAQDETPEGGTEQQDEREAGASGVQRSDRMQDTGSTSQEAVDDPTKLPYKQIGDVLEEWYRQHRQIESAQQPEDDNTSHPEDVDMGNVGFEHLPNQDAGADTQALGTASAEQSTALDEDSGLPFNDEKDTTLPPINESHESAQEDHDRQEGGTQVDPSDSRRSEKVSNAFIGEPQTSDLDVDMTEEITADEEDRVRDVDQQLTDTHLDGRGNADELSLEDARKLWSEHEATTRNLALVLTEHLRLVLQPTQATKMRGDFRTGKRLNIKRIIPYIASSYKRDKIWMRRSVPSKRSYQVMLAIDDSKSMAESDSKHIALETVALVAKAMSMLEVGELSVVGFGENVNVAHDFSTPFTSDAGAQVFKQFSFAQSRTNVRKLFAESIELFRSARLKAAGSASELWQLQLIISDGVCEDHSSIRQLVRQAHEERIMVVFIIVDAAAQKAHAAGGPKQSILDLQTAEFVKDQAGEMQLKMVKYLDTFPFQYYLIVRDVQELPAVLAGALRQWFAEVVETGG